MYGAAYSAPPPPAPGRPTQVMVGALAVFGAAAMTLAETVFEILIFQDFSRLDTSGELATSLQPWLIITIVLNMLVTIGLGMAALLTIRRQQVGRILIWSVGGLCAALRLCCLSGIGMFGAINAAVGSAATSSDTSMSQLAPGWEIAGSAIFGILALAAVTVAMIMVGLRPVGAWFRAARPAAPVAPPQPYRPYGY
jgi:hypothetical protein